MTAIQVVYLIQIVVLSFDIYMAIKARRALNGLGRGLIFLMALLIGRRIDDFNNNADDPIIASLSSAVVTVVTYDLYQIYKMRSVYAMWQAQRQMKIEELEQMRKNAEKGASWDRQPVSRI